MLLGKGGGIILNKQVLASSSGPCYVFKDLCQMQALLEFDQIKLSCYGNVFVHQFSCLL